MKYFIFDVDGTLMNSAAVDQQCLKQTLHEFGRDYTFEELRPSFGKPGRQTLYRRDRRAHHGPLGGPVEGARF